MLLAFVVFLVSCSSAQKRAEKLLEHAQFEEAIPIFETILKEDPGNAEALSGLRKAQAGWIDHKLISVRMTRLAGNSEEATRLLLEAHQKQLAWGGTLPAKVAFTKEEESQYALQFAQKRIPADLAQGFPLRAEVFLQRYRPILAGSSNTSGSTKVWPELHQLTLAAGKKSCAEWLKFTHAGRPFFGRFRARYCQLWGEQAPENNEEWGLALQRFYRSFNVLWRDGTSMELPLRLSTQETLRITFERTGWFDPKGAQALPLQLNGAYLETKGETPVRLSHSYTAQEEYYDNGEKKQPRWPNSPQNRRLLGSPSSPNSFDSQDSAPVKKIRNVTREHSYMGTRKELALKIQLGVSALLDGGEISPQFENSFQDSGIEHDENQPRMGLLPKKVTFPIPAEWRKAQLENFSARFADQLIDRWRSVYCKPTALGDSATAAAQHADAVELCLRQNFKETPSLVQSWYLKTLGVTLEDSDTVLKRSGTP